MQIPSPAEFVLLNKAASLDVGLSRPHFSPAASCGVVNASSFTDIWTGESLTPSRKSNGLEIMFLVTATVIHGFFSLLKLLNRLVILATRFPKVVPLLPGVFVSDSGLPCGLLSSPKARPKLDDDLTVSSLFCFAFSARLLLVRRIQPLKLDTAISESPVPCLWSSRRALSPSRRIWVLLRFKLGFTCASSTRSGSLEDSRS